MSTLLEKANEIKEEKDNKIIPENIKKDVKIFDIIGTLEGGDGGVKLFTTIGEMRADPNPQEGDLALVYGTTTVGCRKNAEFNKVYFPETVVVNSLPTTNYMSQFIPVDDTKDTGMAVGLFVEDTEPCFKIEFFNEDERTLITYNLRNNNTFVRDSEIEQATFLCDLNFFLRSSGRGAHSIWNDLNRKFVQIDICALKGLFQYTEYTDFDGYDLLLREALTYDAEDDGTNINNAQVDYELTSGYYVNGIDLVNMVKKIIEEEGFDLTYGQKALYSKGQDGEDIILFAMDEEDGKIDNILDAVLISDTNTIKGIIPEDNMYVTGINAYLVDFDNESYTYYGTTPMSQSAYSGKKYSMLNPLMKCLPLIVDLTSVSASFNIESDKDSSNDHVMCQPDAPQVKRYIPAKTQLTLNSSDQILKDEIALGQNGEIIGTLEHLSGDVKLFETVEEMQADPNPHEGDKAVVYENTSSPYFEGLFEFYDGQYNTIETQLTLETTDQLLPGLVALGKYGVITGDGSIITPDNSFVDTPAYLYNSIQDAYNAMNPRVLTDADKNIDKNIRRIPAKSDGTSLLDTSNVTDMSLMFFQCSNLASIPLLDASNVINMEGMFVDCSSLTSVPLLDTSNVTNMTGMFDCCYSLTSIPQLNTGNVTNMSTMLHFCSNLTSIPQLDTGKVTNMEFMFSNCPNLEYIPQLNTSNVTSMLAMFEYCSSLTSIPQLDTSNVEDMGRMFDNCQSLTNESLNNILAMCTNATKMPFKTLQYIGLTEDQATRCQSLSNYPAFISAGWTTGY